MSAKRFYDPEYDRLVDESVIKKQYEWFAKQKWFDKSYEQFKRENFRNANGSEIKEGNS